MAELLMVRRDGEATIHLAEKGGVLAVTPPPCGQRARAWNAVDAPIDSDICPECLYRLRLVEAKGE